MINIKEELQDLFIRKLCKNRIAVSIFLKTGIQLKGEIEAFDQQSIVLKSIINRQMIYKHAIATILPAKEITFPEFAEYQAD